ncbi:hypothetical protein BH09DEP1_BH09DEP1_0220 [soil metagenome]
MISTTILKMSLFACISLVSYNASAKMVEYYEDAYTQQAPQELADKVAKIADKIAFAKDYEVVIPKKPGLQINPANKIVSYGINPQTKNPFVLINPDWFSTLNQEQQDFLIARSLVTLENSKWHALPKLFTPLWLVIFLASGLLAFYALKKKYLAGKPTWMLVLATVVPFLVVDTALGPVHDKMSLNIIRRFDVQMARIALEKMGQDKQVAISTFQVMDDFVKKELAAGDTFWKPYEGVFSDLVARLSNK